MRLSVNKGELTLALVFRRDRFDLSKAPHHRLNHDFFAHSRFFLASAEPCSAERLNHVLGTHEINLRSFDKPIVVTKSDRTLKPTQSEWAFAGIAISHPTRRSSAREFSTHAVAHTNGSQHSYWRHA